MKNCFDTRTTQPSRLTTAVKVFITLLLAASLVACDEENSATYNPTYSTKTVIHKTLYRFGIHPLHNPERLNTVFGPLVDYLSRNVDNATFRLEASRNYASYDKKLYSRQFHFSLPNPYQTVNAIEKGYRVFAKMGDDENFRGIILVRRDSGIEHPSQLKGKAVSFPAPSALAATMLPQYYLQTHGLDVMHDIDIRYVGSQESSIMNVLIGDTTAGATWPPPWKALIKERPDIAKQVKVIWQTKPLPNNSLVARDDIPESVVQQVAQLLVNLHQHEEGRTILRHMELSRFESASEKTYQPVRDFIKTFEQTVRPAK